MVAEWLAVNVGWLAEPEWQAVVLSLRVAFWAVLASLPLGLFTAYALARWRFPGHSIVNALVHLPLVLPPVVTGYVLLLGFGTQGLIGRVLDEAFGLRFAFEWTGAALACAIMSFPLMVRAMRIAFEAVDPGLEEAAATLGSGRWTVLRTITLPLAMPGIIAGLVLAFAKAMGEFGATITFVSNIPGRTQTIPSAIYAFLQVPGGEDSAFRLIAVSVAISVVAVIVAEVLARRAAASLKERR